MESYPKILSTSTLLHYWKNQYAEVRQHPPRDWVPNGKDWGNAVDDLVDDCVTSDMNAHILRQQKIQQLMRKGNKAQPYRFITISYPKEAKPEDFVRRVRKWQSTKWQWGSNRIQRFEFTGKAGYHPHIHMMVFTDKKKSAIISELSRKVKLEKNFIDCLDGRYKEHIAYIKGQKQESKQAQMDADADQRNILGLSEYEEYQATPGGLSINILDLQNFGNL